MNRNQHLSIAAGSVAVLFLAVAAAFSEEPAKSKLDVSDEQLNTQLLKLCRDDTHGYTMTFADDRSARLEPKEVMKWTNPVRFGQLGVVFLWLKDGRAEAMSTVFTNPFGDDGLHVNHEFQSLSLRRLVATNKAGAVRWAPAQAGITLRPIPGAPEPADSPAARLRQMRSLVREFSAHSVSYYDGEKRWELRMLAQPLQRYETKPGDVLDGAVFAFVSNAGTDPELILPIEARKVGDRWVWHAAGARFSDHSLHLRHQDREIWTFINQGRSHLFAADTRDIYRIFQDRVLSTSGVRSGTTVSK